MSFREIKKDFTRKSLNGYTFSFMFRGKLSCLSLPDWKTSFKSLHTALTLFQDGRFHRLGMSTKTSSLDAHLESYVCTQSVPGFLFGLTARSYRTHLEITFLRVHSDCSSNKESGKEEHVAQ